MVLVTPEKIAAFMSLMPLPIGFAGFERLA